MKDKFLVAGIGELLWDVFPTHKRLGGAPANFACHCNQLGATAYPVSCIGVDLLGELVCEQLESMGVDSSYVAESDCYPTGTVDVSLEAGKPTYKIHEGVAWDHIAFSSALSQLAQSLDGVCFGSLSQRSDQSRATICLFLQKMEKSALRIFDVNLRQSFFSRQQIEESLDLANVLKLSDEELPVLAGYFQLGGDVTSQLMGLRERFDLKLVAYTRGPEGSVLLDACEVDDFPGCEGLAVDSVGAGDSFTAALCMGLLKGWSKARVNKFANRVATFVCSQKGATPMLPAHLVNDEG